MKKLRIFPRSGLKSVTLIAALFICSAGVRIISGTDAVFAAETIEPQASEKGVVAETPPKTKAQTEMSKLLSTLLEREQIVEEREKAINDRMEFLKDAEQSINQRLRELQVAEEKLRDTIALAETAAEGDLQKLTTVYENMKPKDAAALFEEMAPDFAAGFLSRMRPDSAADIMSGLSPDIAYSLSAILAGRNANVPSE